MSNLRSSITAALALALAACATGPNYVAPVASPSAAAPFVTTTAAVNAAAEADPDWWKLYRDPSLDRLVADTLAANTDVRVAVARLAKARASLREVKTDRLPQAGLSASGTYGRASAGQTAPGADREGWTVDTGLDVAYEVDLFGRVSRNVEAARGDVGAAEADADAVRVAVVADTTRAYADAVSASARLAVAQRIVALLDESVRLTSRRQQVGLTTRLDTSRLSALRNQRQAEVPSILAERQAAIFRLATLTGRTPGQLPADLLTRTAPLRVDNPIPVGDGAALLARRPDLRAAERRLAASNARIGVATADLYPRITLGGSLGSTGTGIGDLFGGGPLRWLLGPLISWSFSDHQRARARVAGAGADRDAALAQFDGSVLVALQETETALSTYARSLDRRTALQAARDDAAVAARITRAQQREGQIDSLAALDAERTLADTEQALVQQDGAISIAQIDLFRALGGGWQGHRSS